LNNKPLVLAQGLRWVGETSGEEEEEEEEEGPDM
jgi:hypothetical protein